MHFHNMSQISHFHPSAPGHALLPFSYQGLCLELIQPSNLAEQWQQNRSFLSQGSEQSYLINAGFSARKDVKALLWMAAGTRDTPLPSDLSKHTREVPGEFKSTGDGRALERFLPSLVSRGVSRGAAGLRDTGTERGRESDRPWRPRREGATQWCRLVRPRPRAPGRGGGRGGNPSGTVTRVAAGPPRACGMWGHARGRGGLRAPPATEARTPCMAQCTVWLLSPAVPGETVPSRPLWNQAATLLLTLRCQAVV